MLRRAAWTGLAATVLATPLHAQAARDLGVADQYEVACDRGDLPSCVVLGLIYETGADGVPPDRAAARGLYRRACDAEVLTGCDRLDLLATTSAVERGALDPFHRVGRIADAETGDPIAGAVVTLSGGRVREMSDLAGRVDLGRLGRGRYRMAVVTGGYGRLDAELPVPWDGEFLILMESGSEASDPERGAVIGRVTDAGGVNGLADVEVSVAGDGTTGTLTDPSGWFSLPELEPGPVELRIARLGYVPRSVTVAVVAGRTVEVAARLAMGAVELAPIEVTVGAEYLERSGFYRRARTSWGTRLTRTDLAELAPLRVTDLLDRAPGVAVVRGPFGTRVVTRRQAPTGGRDACMLRIWLDGVPAPDWDPDDLGPDDLAGIEIYQGASVPIEYRTPVAVDGTPLCGAVLFWTRRPG